jgi:hypothetical protein
MGLTVVVKLATQVDTNCINGRLIYLECSDILIVVSLYQEAKFGPSLDCPLVCPSSLDWLQLRPVQDPVMYVSHRG